MGSTFEWVSPVGIDISPSPSHHQFGVGTDSSEVTDFRIRAMASIQAYPLGAEMSYIS